MDRTPQRYGGDMERYGERFLHIDMDAFFVEVERRRDPSLIGKPVVVGGLGPRGVVASASYEARTYGVHSAMPIVEARRLCPHGRFVAPSHGAYGEVSDEVFAIFRSFTPLVEGLSVDEAFLDISGLRLHYDTPADVGAALRRTVREEVGLPASVGIAAVKFISKLASEEAKPDGMHIVPAGTELDFLHPMPVRRLWGVGQATHATLEALGIGTIGDLSHVPEALLAKRLGPSLARHLSQLALANDPRQVEPGAGAKSISVEETYDEDLTAEEEIKQNLLRLCDRVATRLHRSGVVGRVVSLKVRFGDFETVSRSETMPAEIGAAPAIWDEAQRLLDRIDRGRRGVRLLGVGLSGLTEAAEPRQLALGEPSRQAAADAVEVVRDKFGDDAVFRASFIPGADEKPRDR